MPLSAAEGRAYTLTAWSHHTRFFLCFLFSPLLFFLSFLIFSFLFLPPPLSFRFRSASYLSFRFCVSVCLSHHLFLFSLLFLLDWLWWLCDFDPSTLPCYQDDESTQSALQHHKQDLSFLMLRIARLFLISLLVLMITLLLIPLPHACLCPVSYLAASPLSVSSLLCVAVHHDADAVEWWSRWYDGGGSLSTLRLHRRSLKFLPSVCLSFGGKFISPASPFEASLSLPDSLSIPSFFLPFVMREWIG